MPNNEKTLRKIKSFIDRLEFLQKSRVLHNRALFAMGLPQLPNTDFSGRGPIDGLVGEAKALLNHHEEFVKLWHKVYFNEMGLKTKYFLDDKDKCPSTLYYKINTFLGFDH